MDRRGHHSVQTRDNLGEASCILKNISSTPVTFARSNYGTVVTNLCRLALLFLALDYGSKRHYNVLIDRCTAGSITNDVSGHVKGIPREINTKREYGLAQRVSSAMPSASTMPVSVPAAGCVPQRYVYRHLNV